MTEYFNPHDRSIDDAQKIKVLTNAVKNYQMVNRALEMISVETDFDRSVNSLLSMIGLELRADRCYVCKFSPDCAYSDNTHEWTSRPGLEEIQNLQHVPMPQDNLRELLEHHQPVVIDDTANPPENLRQTVELLLPQSIKSIFVVGLWAKGKLSGFFGVDYVDRCQRFSESMLQILQDAAKLYDIVCERYRNQQEIEQKNTQLRNREALLELIINSLPANIFAKDAGNQFKYVMANCHFAKFVGKTVDQLIGKTDCDLFAHKEDSQWFEQRDAEIMAEGKSKNFPETAFDANGNKIQLQTVKTPCIGPSGKKLLLGVSVDITRNKNLSKSHEIIKQCLETLVLNPDLEAGISRSIEQVREYINADRIYLFQFDFKQKTGSVYKEFCAPGTLPALTNVKGIPFSTAFDWERHFQKECFLSIPDLQREEILKQFGSYYRKIIREKNGRSLYCHRLLINGKLWGYVGIVYDNTARVLNSDELDFIQSAARFVEIMIQHEHMQSELLLALKEAKSAEKAKSNFLATMSHEIRTPLNAVIGFSEILKDGTLPVQTQKSYLNNISVAGNALLSLINDVLDLSKLESGQMVFTPTETDFSALIQEVMTIFQQRIRDKKLECILSMQPMPTLLLDKIRMRQILFNLIGNAVKFTDSGHIELKSTFVPDKEATGTLCFSLTDTGCGISPEDQKRLFQPFVQSNAIRGTQVAKNGTGLGLAIIRRLLDRLHGDIQLQSTPGKGSTFSVVMHEIGYVVKRRVQTQQIPSAEPRLEKSFSGRVLVIDDVVMNLKVTQAMLEKLGVSSEIANGPEAALQLLDQPDLSLILCDLWMPKMNGDELVRKIRKLYPGRKWRIVALTADTEPGANTFDLSAFDSVLHKPVTLDHLRKLLFA
ncbi:MAG: ATP-binding protein [Victivallaceae bacterium]|nr:ATP-binding protein [Victivallaceae bacterium]